MVVCIFLGTKREICLLRARGCKQHKISSSVFTWLFFLLLNGGGVLFVHFLRVSICSWNPPKGSCGQRFLGWPFGRPVPRTGTCSVLCTCPPSASCAVIARHGEPARGKRILSAHFAISALVQVTSSFCPQPESLFDFPKTQETLFLWKLPGPRLLSRIYPQQICETGKPCILWWIHLRWHFSEVC